MAMPRLARSSHTMSNITRHKASSIYGKNLFAKTLPTEQKRFLDLHEYQSKALMATYGIRVQNGQVASSVEEALEVATKIKSSGAEDLILKAQIHAGGRGKGHFNTGFKGGVKICSQPDEVANYAKEMFGNNLITHQTGPEGQPVKKVLVHEGISFDRELYFAILMDRSYNGPVLVVSPAGGMDIEDVSANHPEQISMIPVDIVEGITKEQTQKAADILGFTAEQSEDAQQQMARLYELFIGSDATQVEINPLVVTKEGSVFCVDAKINFDDNAAHRQKNIFEQRDFSMEDPREVAASKVGLNYIGLDGNIGCMVNGAGLAMATMDIIKLHGGDPANFLDVGGGATEDQVEEAFKILTADPKVEALLVNIFGGIMKCDIISQGIVNAAKKIGLKIPLVVRLEGTNVEQGVKILNDSGLTIITASDLDDAAKKAVSAIN